METKLPLRHRLASTNQKLGFVFAQRYRVLEFISETSLSQCYWVEDIQTFDINAQASRALLIVVNPSLAQLENFSLTLARVLPQFSTTLPAVLDSAFTVESTWYVLSISEGYTLEQQIKSLGRHGLSVPDTLKNAETILATVRKTPLQNCYGYLEAGSILKSADNQLLFLNTPLAVTLKLLTSSQPTKSKLSLNSSFISPEVAMGNKPIESDDTFSFAALIYYMLNGHLPFVLDNSIEAAIKKASPATVIKLPQHRWQALARGLAYKRDQRHPNPEGLLFDLNTAQPPKPNLLQRYGLVLSSLSLLLIAYGAFSWWRSIPAISQPSGSTLDASQLEALKQAAQQQAIQQEQAYAEATQKLKDIQQQQAQAEQRLAQLLEQQQQLSQPTVPPLQAQPTKQQTSIANNEREQRLLELESQQKQAEETLKQLESQEQQAAAKRQLEQDQQHEQAAKLAALQAEQQRQKEAEEAKRLAELARQQALAKEEAEAARQREFEKQQAAAEEAKRLAQLAEQERLELLRQQEAEETNRLAQVAEQQALAKQQAELAAAQLVEQKRLELLQKQQAETKRLEEEAKKQAERQQAELVAQAAEAQRIANLQKQQVELARQQALQRQQAIAAEQQRRELELVQQAEIKPSANKNQKHEQPQQHELSERQQSQAQLTNQPQTIITSTKKATPVEILAIKPSPYPPQLIVNPNNPAELIWDNPKLFGSVPSKLQATGNRICQESGLSIAMGYHSKALDENAKAIDDGGYLCK